MGAVDRVNGKNQANKIGVKLDMPDYLDKQRKNYWKNRTVTKIRHSKYGVRHQI